MTFLLSTLVLVTAPLLYGVLHRYRRSRDALEGFVLVTIAGIVVLHIVPGAWELAGLSSLIALAVGAAFPLLLERIYRRALERAHLFVLILAAVGIVVHAVLDGIALLPEADGGGILDNELALGVILHRLPVGVAVWWVLRPQFGPVPAMCVLALIVVATGASYFFGAGLLTADLGLLALFQSFVAGSLLHVALVGTTAGHTGEGHHEHADPVSARSRWAAVLGPRRTPAFWAGLGVGVVTVMLLPHVSFVD
ncbi:MAG: hypothetical protein AB7I04_16930 [Pseudomonadales bacterium]